MILQREKMTSNKTAEINNPKPPVCHMELEPTLQYLQFLYEICMYDLVYSARKHYWTQNQEYSSKRSSLFCVHPSTVPQYKELHKYKMVLNRGCIDLIGTTSVGKIKEQCASFCCLCLSTTRSCKDTPEAAPMVVSDLKILI